ncbi:MAG TPA: amidohydrolase family protein [Phnomibacter sp.]|nr:amidohydrolase family protein [Phnomibacter sp.]
MKRKFPYLIALVTLTALTQILAQVPDKYLLINNVQIFNGKEEKLLTGNVLVLNNRIQKISTAPIATNRSANTQIIDGKGKFLMPGLIDAHAHIMSEAISIQSSLTADFSYITLVASVSAGAELLRGFTTIRDVAGPSFGLKRAIDEGLVPGPRIFPSGAGIGQTSGHSDFRSTQDVPMPAGTPLSFVERNNFGIVADGADQVLFRVREQLKLGASHIKLMAGGGVASR